MTRINPTHQDITAAEQALAETKRTLDGAQALMDQRQPGAALAWAAAQGNHDKAQQSLDELHAQRDLHREVEAEAAFMALLKKHQKDLAGRADELESGRERVTAAIAKAQESLLALLDAVTDQNVLIHQHAAEVAALGFAPFRDGHTSAEPGKGLVGLRGETWQPVNPGVLFGQVVERVRVARLDPRNYYLIHQQGRGHATARIAADVVARVAPPKRVDYVNPFPRFDHAPIESPVSFRDEYAREEARRANEQAYRR